MADYIDILVEAYVAKLKGAIMYNGVPVPVYNGFLPSTESSPCYVLISEVSASHEPAKRYKNETADINIGVYSESREFDPDKVMSLVDAQIIDDMNVCLLIMPAGYQTWITTYTSNKQTMNLAPNAQYMNRFKTYTHQIFKNS